MDDQHQVVNEFLVECYENLDQLDRDLLVLEHDPTSCATLGTIFRTIHTIKGTCGFLGFGKLESVTHVGESLLSKLRDGNLTLQPEITTGLLRLVDAVREILDNIETLGLEGEADYSSLIQTLVDLQSQDLLPAYMAVTRPAEVCVEPIPVTDFAAERVPEPVPQPRETHDDVAKPVGDDVAKAVGDDVAKPVGNAADRTIRVDVELLDKLMNHVGELVLARNQLLQFAGNSGDTALQSTSQRLSAITTELQQGVMKTRMQPIGNIWSKFPRVVRDLALQCGKRVRIEMEGEETELDKTIIELIKDPLTHLVRNAIDHGIESSEARRAAGKSPEGRLLLRAFHEGGQVKIEITDDGGGLNLDRIREKALEKKLISEEQAQRMSDYDAAQLILAPGFSTAAKVTTVSGRGVGMDVVKTNVEKIGGALDIESQLGQGTTVRLKIPLTLAIIPALIITAGRQRYAIPQANLQELVRLDPGAKTMGIEFIQGTPVYRLRGRLLPLVDLCRELEVSDTPLTLAQHGATAPVAVQIVVLRADDRQFGLIVDAINDREEIVVKPLPSQLKGIPVFAGATIMGDGRVSLILDILGIAQRVQLLSGDHAAARRESIGEGTERSGDHQNLLLLAVGDCRFALPTAQIARLEVIRPTQIEHSDGREVVQYRSEILPLLRLRRIFGLPSDQRDEQQPLHVVICTEAGRSVGLAVDQIVDVVHVPIDVNRAACTEGVLCSAVIGEHVTDLIDLPAMIRLARFSAPSRQLSAADQEVIA